MTARIINLAEARRARELRPAPVVSGINILMIAGIASSLLMWAVVLSAFSHAVSPLIRVE